jgi:2-hydroxy-6-oxonona-2,4-dienedioate hydrolase
MVSSRYMVPTLKRLARHYRIYAPDLPGFGKSEKPSRTLDVAGLSDALYAWMDALGLEGAALVGNSISCQITADLAVRRPELVERAVLQGASMDLMDIPSPGRSRDSSSTCPASPRTFGASHCATI